MLRRQGLDLEVDLCLLLGLDQSFHWFLLLLLLLLLSEHIEVKKTSISKDAVKVFSHPILDRIAQFWLCAVF